MPKTAMNLAANDKTAATLREQALPYVGHAVDDALSVRTGEPIPSHARLIGWQCGFEPMYVAVWSYLPGCTLDDEESIEIATDYLSEIGWFSGKPTDPDYVI